MTMIDLVWMVYFLVFWCRCFSRLICMIARGVIFETRLFPANWIVEDDANGGEECYHQNVVSQNYKSCECTEAFNWHYRAQYISKKSGGGSKGRYESRSTSMGKRVCNSLCSTGLIRARDPKVRTSEGSTKTTGSRFRGLIGIILSVLWNIPLAETPTVHINKYIIQ